MARPAVALAPTHPRPHASRAPHSVSKSQQAYDWIRARIDDGRFSPGHRLVLAQIADEVGVSVVPVREAIRRLEAETLVTFERNVGAHVAAIDTVAYLHTMETLGLVEGAATRMAAPYITPEQLARARALNDEMVVSLDELVPQRFTRLNREFHAVLCESCPNPHVLDLVQRGWNRMNALRDSTFAFVPGRARQSVAEHTRLLELIESGAGDMEIELAARHHRFATLDAFLAYRAELAQTEPRFKEEK